ncbi:hypothetical protein RGQ29_031140 [Quercus rubra]|uniref:Uncharacterized protein n=1 Tax=Quercus rubra TaxID=3512 RepID=A0AAN7IF86_QUERU|nr:hypothetical protein RGQ29_031140 [Quercus rubra]
MRQRELLDFRTPQHPSLGTNNWGGASSFYLRLNTIRTRYASTHKYAAPTTPSHSSRKGFLSKLMFP